MLGSDELRRREGGLADASERTSDRARLFVEFGALMYELEFERRLFNDSVPGKV